MDFAGIIIVLVIALIGYIARSVEKQNSREKKYREARRGSRAGTGPMRPLADESRAEPEPQATDRPEPPQERPQEETPAAAETMERPAGTKDLLTRYREAQQRLSHLDRIDGVGEIGSESSAPGRAASLKAEAPDWLKSRSNLREAFIFSELIGKPRALNPHPCLKRRQSSGQS